MNKAKFMLLGIGVVGVVSGALAFKAQKFVGNKYCTSTTSSSCPASPHYLTAVFGAHLRCTAVASTTCTQTITVVAPD